MPGGGVGKGSAVAESDKITVAGIRYGFDNKSGSREVEKLQPIAQGLFSLAAAVPAQGWATGIASCGGHMVRNFRSTLSAELALFDTNVIAKLVSHARPRLRIMAASYRPSIRGPRDGEQLHHVLMELDAICRVARAVLYRHGHPGPASRHCAPHASCC